MVEQANLNVESPNEQISVSSNSGKEESAYNIDNSSENENMFDVEIQDTIASTKLEVHENIEPKQDDINENLQVEAVLNPCDKKIDAEDPYVDTLKERANISEHHKNFSEIENLDNRDNIEITALPPSGKCGKRNKNALKEPKVIIDGVSGTAMPGQFIAIIGASGKFNLHLISC